MSNVTECIDLYLTDQFVTDAQFRAIIVDAHARDLVEHAADDTRKQLAEHAHALVLLNQIDDLRHEMMGSLQRQIDTLASVVFGTPERMEREGA